MGIDWISWTTFLTRDRETPDDLASRAVAVLRSWFGDPDPLEHGLWGYDDGVGFRHGAMVLWSSNRPYASLVVNGDSLATLDGLRMLDLLSALRRLGGRPSRLDLCVDDYERTFTMEQVRRAAERFDFAGFRRTSIYVQRNRSAPSGFTVYFGARGCLGSGRMYRFYDKGLESHGQILSNRVEIELSQDRAATVAEQLATCSRPDEAAALIAGIVAGNIQFVVREGCRLDRMKPLPWWSRFVARLHERPILELPRTHAPLQRAAEWAVGRGRDDAGHILPLLIRYRRACLAEGLDFVSLLEAKMDRLEHRIDNGRWKYANSAIDPAKVFG